MYSFISGRIGAEWDRLARNLNIDDLTIDEIDKNSRGDRYEDKCRQVFVKLKEKTRVTWNHVREALHEIRRNDIVDDFEKRFFKVTQ